MSRGKYVIVAQDVPGPHKGPIDLLRANGYRVEVISIRDDALVIIDQRVPDMVLMDIDRAAGLAFELLRKIRHRSNVPLVITSSSKNEKDKVQALEAGADDYLIKPYFNEELLARIAALLRRVSWTPQSETILEVGYLRLDMTRRQVTLRNKHLQLTPIEYAILCTLMQRAGEVVTHDELLESVWGPGYQGDFSVLRVNISRLRRKVEERPRSPRYIVTVPRQGYQMPAVARV